MQMTRLEPGLLISLKTNIRGNTTYKKIDLDDEIVAGVAISRWETERRIEDPKENEEAVKVRSKCRSIIGAVCIQTSGFGFLCRNDRRRDLDQAVREAKQVAETFNRRARYSNVHVSVIVGEISANDTEALSSIRREVREMLEDMEAGLRSFDVAKIRDTANRARTINQILPADANEKMQVAIDAARQAARRIVKASETGAMELDRLAIRTLRESRTMFLEPEEESEADGILTPDFAPRSLDLDFLPDGTPLTSDALPL